MKHIEGSESIEQLKLVEPHLDEQSKEAYSKKYESLMQLQLTERTTKS